MIEHFIKPDMPFREAPVPEAINFEFWKATGYSTYCFAGIHLLSRAENPLMVSRIQFNDQNGWGYANNDKLVSLSDERGVFVFRFEPPRINEPAQDFMRYNVHGGKVGGIILTFNGSSYQEWMSHTQEVQNALYTLIQDNLDGLRVLPQDIKDHIKQSAEFQKSFLGAHIQTPPFSRDALADIPSGEPEYVKGIVPIELYDQGRKLIEIVADI
jgi:hypothetical protein